MSEALSSATQLPLKYIKIFFRRKWWLAVPSVIGLVAGIIAGAMMPRIFQSSSLVLVEEEKTINPLISGIAVSMDVVSRMKTIREQILGWNSLVQIVDRLKLDKNVKSQLEYEQLVMDLRSKINVRMRGPNLIEISFPSAKPDEAKQVVQTVNDIFIEENMKTQERESSIAIDFLKDQIKVYRRKIKEAEIAKYNDELKGMLADSTEEHPMVKDLRAKIAELEKDMDDPGFNVDDAKPVMVSQPAYDALVRQQLGSTIDQAMGNAGAGGGAGAQPSAAAGLTPLSQVNPSKTASNDELYQLLLLDKLDGTMARDSAINENIYNMLLQRLETAKITQRLEASKQGTRYTVLDPPRLPLRPIKPNKVVVLLVGLFLGVAVGVGLVLLLEFSDQSLLGIDEAKEFLEYPILGGISRILTEADIAANRAKNRFSTFVFISVSLVLIVVTSLYSFLNKP